MNTPTRKITRLWSSPLLVAACVLAAGGCANSADMRVHNGAVYEHGSVSLESVRAVVVPANARVRFTAPNEIMLVYVAKDLHFWGHPPVFMGLGSTRKFMGVATRVDSGNLLVATFGEWDSHIEGGASVSLLIEVPAGFGVERRSDLSGEDSLAHVGMEPRRVDESGWYGPTAPGPGWTRLALKHDPERRASGSAEGPD